MMPQTQQLKVTDELRRVVSARPLRRIDVMGGSRWEEAELVWRPYKLDFKILFRIRLLSKRIQAFIQSCTPDIAFRTSK